MVLSDFVSFVMEMELSLQQLMERLIARETEGMGEMFASPGGCYLP
jgi:hypothetical protein